MSFITDSAPAEAPDSAENRKAVTTKRDVLELLKSFEPAVVAAPSAAEKERERRLGRWETNVRSLAKTFEELGGVDGTAVSAAATLKALRAVHARGAAAISSLSDAKLTGVTPAPKTRTVKSAPSEQAPAAAESAVPDQGQAEEPSDFERNVVAAQETQAEAPDEGEHSSGGSEAAPSTPRSGPRSGPGSAASAPRGESDPNVDDGF